MTWALPPADELPTDDAPVVHLAAGREAAAALDADGQVFFWPHLIREPEAPLRLPPLSGVVRIATAAGFVAAITTDGEVMVCEASEESIAQAQWTRSPTSSPMNDTGSLVAGMCAGLWGGYVAVLCDGRPVFAEVGTVIAELPFVMPPPRTVAIAPSLTLALAPLGLLHTPEGVFQCLWRPRARTIEVVPFPLPCVDGHEAQVLSLCTAAALAVGKGMVSRRVHLRVQTGGWTRRIGVLRAR